MTVILVTRPAGDDDQLVAALRARGYRVRAVPTVATKTLDVRWPDLSGYDWVAVTSATGAGTLPDDRADVRWAAVGNATAAALRRRGIAVEVMPAAASGAALAQAIPEPAGARVLLVRGSLGGDDLPAGLRARGAEVDEIVSYETVEAPPDSRSLLAATLEAGEVAAVVFASGSAVRGFIRLGGPAHIPAITIGPRTTAAATQAGIHVVAEASGQTVAELVAAVERVISIEVGPDA
jgi:uroporphyrinogen-III synthase